MLYLLLALDADRYALNAGAIVEVVPLVALKAIPQAPHGVAGILNYRGTPVPVLDLCALALGRPARSRLTTRIVLVDYTDRRGAAHVLGLIAERVEGTLRCEPDAFRAYGIDNAGTPYLGPVVEDAQGLIQRVEIAHLLPDAVQRMLFPELAA
ncbi:MAG: chemotaxis protein CheW [Candidatus Eremiobacteraeota bacterium]|nr:chemotaxis protein CheW [Candidatus Eremiobacteraeota bacterium]